MSPGNHYSATCRLCSIYSSQLLLFTSVRCTMNYMYRLRHFVLHQSQHRFNDPRLVSSFQQSKSLTNIFVNENQRHGLSRRRLWNCNPAIHYKRKSLKAKIQALCCIVWAGKLPERTRVTYTVRRSTTGSHKHRIFTTSPITAAASRRKLVSDGTSSDSCDAHDTD